MYICSVVEHSLQWSSGHHNVGGILNILVPRSFSANLLSVQLILIMSHQQLVWCMDWGAASPDPSSCERIDDWYGQDERYIERERESEQNEPECVTAKNTQLLGRDL